MQATGTLHLAGGGANDFVFPGRIVLKAGGALDLRGILVNQGWTTTGQGVPGCLLRVAEHRSSCNGNIEVLSNNLNWVNFSTLPHVSCAHLATERRRRTAARATSQRMPRHRIATPTR